MKGDMEDKDHDLLIAIANDTKWIKEWALNHEKDDATNYAEAKSIAKAAHSRMDRIMIGGLLAIILLAISVYFK